MNPCCNAKAIPTAQLHSELFICFASLIPRYSQSRKGPIFGKWVTRTLTAIGRGGLSHPIMLVVWQAGRLERFAPRSRGRPGQRDIEIPLWSTPPRSAPIPTSYRSVEPLRHCGCTGTGPAACLSRTQFQHSPCIIAVERVPFVLDKKLAGKSRRIPVHSAASGAKK